MGDPKIQIIYNVGGVA